VLAVKGFTAEWLDRALECHSARRVLGRIPTTTLPDDPFWLPGRMVDIDVGATRAGFQVFIQGQTIKDAQEILSRANAFVEARAPSLSGRSHTACVASCKLQRSRDCN
jgi:hypothetical protein